MPKPFIHLHCHSDNSSLDGLSNVGEYVKKLPELGMPAMALTDHGIMCGVPEFYSLMRKADLEPIIGCEMYYVPDASWRPPKGSKEQANRHHITVLARGLEGYKTLVELSTASHRQYYFKPLVDRALIESLGDQAKHLTVLSGCVGGPVASYINEGRVGQEEVIDSEQLRMRAAASELAWWREMFPNFYMEIMHHGTEFDKHVNTNLIRLARRYGVPLVATNDPHFVEEGDAHNHDILLAIQTGSDLDDESRFRFDGHGYHLRSRSEMAQTMRPYGKSVWEEASSNTVAIAKDCKVRIPDWERRQWHIPKFPDTTDPVKALRVKCIRELKRIGKFDDPEYVERTKHELAVFNQVVLEDFMLITADILEEARRRGIPVGPGRGSVCGSLVGYLIGIHRMDPIKYNLLFERFLNPERPKMPDIDSDFGKARRAEMFEYVTDKYGVDNVVLVAAFQKLRIRKAWHTLAKAHGVPFGERMEIAKGLPQEEDGVEDALPPEIVERFPDLVEQIIRFNGIKSGVSQHPAGVIIADPRDKIRELVPEMWMVTGKKMVGQYDLSAAEDTGLLKEDLLSLRSLDTIKEAIDIIEEETGERLDPDSWVPDEEEHDAEIYEMIAAGDTGGVFQMEGPTNMRGCKAVKPNCFEDLVSITSLYRTGPINAGFPKIFLKNREIGLKNIDYAHPTLKPILEPTFGVILYQEQVMEIGLKLAGFNMIQVDDIKEAIKKKKSSMMDDLKPVFFAGCRSVSGMKDRAIDDLWLAIEGYSGYSYNRSHAVAYSFVTYQTARLKHLYPLAFVSALLRTVEPIKQNEEKRSWYLRDALRRDLRILPPDINISGARATSDKANGAMRFGLADVSGIGTKTADKIIANRPEGGYVDLEQIKSVVNNVGHYAKLEQASVLESLGVPGDPELTETMLKWTFKDPMDDIRAKYAKHYYPPVKDDGSIREKVRIIGIVTRSTKATTKSNKPYLNWRVRWSLTESFHIRLWSGTERHWDVPEGSIVAVVGEWDEKWGNVSVGSPKGIKLLKRG